MANPAVQFITLDKFKLRVTEKLGQGSFATVYKAVNQVSQTLSRLKRNVAELTLFKCLA